MPAQLVFDAGDCHVAGHTAGRGAAHAIGDDADCAFFAQRKATPDGGSGVEIRLEQHAIAVRHTQIDYQERVLVFAASLTNVCAACYRYLNRTDTKPEG